MHVAVGGPLPVTRTVARAFANAAASEPGLSGSGEAWRGGVPPRHCPAGEESMRGVDERSTRSRGREPRSSGEAGVVWVPRHCLASTSGGHAVTHIAGASRVDPEYWR